MPLCTLLLNLVTDFFEMFEQAILSGQLYITPGLETFRDDPVAGRADTYHIALSSNFSLSHTIEAFFLTGEDQTSPFSMSASQNPHPNSRSFISIGG